MADDKLTVKVEALTAGVAPALDAVAANINKLKEVVEGITGPLQKVYTSLKQLGEAFLVFEAVKKMGEFIEKLEDMATAALKLGAVMGATIEKVSEFRGVLVAVGGNEAAGTVRTMEHLQRMMSEAMAEPAGRAAQGFKNLGISLADVKAKGNDFYGMMEIMRGAFQQHQEGANLTANFYAIMGRSFDNLVPVLRLTNDQFDEARKRFAATGSNIGAFAERLFHSGEILRTFEQSLTGVSLQLYNVFQPAMDGVILVLTDLVQTITSLLLQFNEFLQTDPAIKTLANTFMVLAAAVGSALEPLAKFVATVLAISADVAFRGSLTFIIVSLQTIAIAAATAAFGVEALGIIFRQMTQANEAADRESKLKMQRNLVEYEQAVARERDNDLVKAKELGKKLEGLDREIGKAHAEAAAQAATNVNTILNEEASAYERFANRVKSILSGIAEASGKGSPFGPKGPTQYGPGVDDRKPVAPIGGRGAGGAKPGTEYMKEWRQALQEQEIATNDFFEHAKERELQYWQEKQAWTKENHAKLVAELVALGHKQEEAQKRIRDMQFQLDSQVFQLRKEQANNAQQEFKKDIDAEVAANKAKLSEKLISELEWYDNAKALQDKWIKYLEANGEKMTKIWKDAVKEREKIDEEHFKNQMKLYGEFFNWVESNITKMVDGVLQGTKTWSDAFKNFAKDMAISFIVEVGKMTARWLIFQALMAVGWTKMAGGVGAGVLGDILGMLGIGGAAKAGKDAFGAATGIAGAAGGATQAAGAVGSAGSAAAGGASAASAAAQAANTAALTKNTVTTLSNTTGLVSNTGDLAKAASTTANLVDSSLTMGAGLVEVSGGLAESVASMAEQIAGDAEIFAGDQELVAAMQELVVALSVDAAASAVPLAVGAWNIPKDMHAVVHKGEMVVPAAASEQLRNGTGLNFSGTEANSSSVAGGGGGGGGAPIINIHTMDAKSFQSYLQDNGHLVMGALGQQVRNGNRSILGTGRR